MPPALHSGGTQKYKNNTRSSSLAQCWALSVSNRSTMRTEKHKKTPVTLTFEALTLKFNTLSSYTCVQNIIKLSVAVHELCTQAFLPYLAIVKNLKIRSCDLDRWPMILKFSGFCAVVKEHVHAKFHWAKCSGSWAIVRTEKKMWTKNRVYGQ